MKCINIVTSLTHQDTQVVRCSNKHPAQSKSLEVQMKVNVILTKTVYCKNPSEFTKPLPALYGQLLCPVVLCVPEVTEWAVLEWFQSKPESCHPQPVKAGHKWINWLRLVTNWHSSFRCSSFMSPAGLYFLNQRSWHQEGKSKSIQSSVEGAKSLLITLHSFCGSVSF